MAVQADAELHMTHSIAVVIVSYNGSSWIRSCISSVLAGQRSAHVIVVDNGSSDGTPALVASEFPSVDLIATGKNVGFGRGNNIGIRRALDLGASYVLLLNQDAFLSPSTLSELAVFMDANPNVGVCTPLHCSPDDTRLDLRTYRGYLGQHAAVLLLDALRGDVKPFYLIPGINAAVWFVRADTFRTVGGFDPLFFMYGEDDDLLARMRFHGVQFALLPNSVAVHLRQSPARKKGSSFDELRRQAGLARASLLMKMKDPGNSASIALALVTSHGLVRPLSDLLVDHQWTQCLASWWASLKVLGEFPVIRRHTLLTRLRGPHFLDLPEK